MKDLSDWINVFFIGMAMLVILNLFLPRVNYPVKHRNKNNMMEFSQFTNSSGFDEPIEQPGDEPIEKPDEIPDDEPIEKPDEKDLKIQELEKEIQHYKERIDDFRSQYSILETLVKNSLVVKEDVNSD